MTTYHLPSTEKIATYYLPPQSSTVSAHKATDPWYSVHSTSPSSPDLESGLLSPALSTTPPPSYHSQDGDPDDDDDGCGGCSSGSGAEPCGLSGGKYIICLLIGMLVLAWVAAGGEGYANPFLAPVRVGKSAWGSSQGQGQGLPTWDGATHLRDPWWNAKPVAMEETVPPRKLPSNRPIECSKMVLREGEIRMDGCWTGEEAWH